jgi:hypothetical protein
MLPELTVAGLARFNTRPLLGNDPEQSSDALEQASMLVMSAVGVSDFAPTDIKGKNLLRYAGYEVAYRLILDKFNADRDYGPMRSETIGNYAYSKDLSRADAVESSTWIPVLRAHVGIGTVR